MTEWERVRDTRVIHEDENVLVINKPAGISVIGERHETDLMRLAKESGEWLMPAHRIDKVTSGALLLAKNLAVHGDLARQFNNRSVRKAYLVITRSTGLPESGSIDLPLSVGRKSKIRIASARESISFDTKDNLWSVPPSEVYSQVKTYPSLSHFTKVWETPTHTALVVRPVTGRRHQIRVHLAWIGHPIEGDPLFDKQAAAAGRRTCLHSWRLSFDEDWNDGVRRHVSAQPDSGFWSVLGPDSDAEAILGAADQALSSIKTTR
jgi:tRNA pseudouridine32 synthase/23S rRNA pseudouridine746 synthase/23S rRNA pseudouridine1911/1915/1917 synthase